MNVKEKFRKVLEALNLVDKATSKELTDEDWKAIVDTYQKNFKLPFRMTWLLTRLHIRILLIRKR